MTNGISVGLVGYGKTGKAVANVLSGDPDIQLRWIARRGRDVDEQVYPGTDIPIVSLQEESYAVLLNRLPVDVLVDFSGRQSIHQYGDEVSTRGISVVSAVSAYEPEDAMYARRLGERMRIICSPNITLGINFLLITARLLRQIAPFADVEILEQHFREKPEISGTAKRMAETLEIEEDKIVSMRLGGIVGYHEVIFGFPHQTVRLAHDSIRREAFGTGAAFALKQLMKMPTGFYTFDELLMNLMVETLTQGRDG